MNITKEITRLEKSSLKLSLTVAKEEVRSEYDELLKEYTKSIQIPGFRKGKVPRDVLVRKFGEALKGEAMGKIMEKAVVKVFEDEAFPRENKPLPYSTPSVQDEPKLDLDSDLSFSVVYDVLPAVKLGKWEELSIEIPDVSISDEDLSRELDVIRERNAIVLDKSDEEKSEMGDVVTVTYCELDRDTGEVLERSEREDFTYTLGTGFHAYEFDDEITGMKKGETREFTKAYPEDHKDFPGKTMKFRLKLTALKRKNLPDLDDDLAQDVDEKFKTLDDLKNSVRQRLEKDLQRMIREIKLNKLLEKIMEDTPVEIPESMLRMELDSRWRNLARRFNTDSEGLYKMMENSAERAESIIESWKPDAVKGLHNRLIIETLMEDLKLEASEEDVEKEIERQAEDSGTDPEEYRKYYEGEQLRDYLKETIKERKALDILLEKNTFTSGKKEKFADLAGNLNIG